MDGWIERGPVSAMVKLQREDGQRRCTVVVTLPTAVHRNYIQVYNTDARSIRAVMCVRVQMKRSAEGVVQLVNSW
jgi:hypothetical protein